MADDAMIERQTNIPRKYFQWKKWKWKQELLQGRYRKLNEVS